jgi:putative ABC transport system permease protein
LAKRSVPIAVAGLTERRDTAPSGCPEPTHCRPTIGRRRLPDRSVVPPQIVLRTRIQLRRAVGIVNEAFARTVFPGQDPIGRRFTYYGSVTGEIVGVVNDVRQQTVGQPPPPQIYTPFDDQDRNLNIAIRSSEGTQQAVSGLRNAIRELDPVLPIEQIGPISDLVSEAVARERFYTAVLRGSALIALLISSLGIFGLTSYSVSRRTREIGVRLALGASTGHIRTVTIGRTTVLAAIGIGLGLVGAFFTTHLLESLLYGLTATDPRVLAAVAIVLSGATVLAAYPPARRAVRVDPIIVLRAE